MADKNRITRRAALGLVGSGAVLLGAETFGFSNVTGTRSVNVETADNPETALLGVTDNSENIDRIDKNPGHVFYLDDNTGGEFSISESAVTLVDYDDCTNNCPNVFLELAENHDYAIAVNCDGTNIDTTGQMSIQIEMNGSGVSVNTIQTTNHSIETKCSGNTESGGFSSVTAGNVARNTPQEFSFSVSGKNMKEGDTVTIYINESSGIDYSDANANVTSGQGNNQHGSALIESERIRFTAGRNINTNQNVKIDVTNYTIIGSTGETYTAHFKRNGKTQSDNFAIED